MESRVNCFMRRELIDQRLRSEVSPQFVNPSLGLVERYPSGGAVANLLARILQVPRERRYDGVRLTISECIEMDLNLAWIVWAPEAELVDSGRTLRERNVLNPAVMVNPLVG